MEITRITEENREYFQPLLPQGERRPEQEWFGLIDSEDTPVASMILSVDSDGEVNLDWIYVDTGRRRQGAGSFFLDGIEDILNGNAASISVSYNDKMPGMEEFLAANGFYLTDGSPVWSVSLSEAIRMPEIQRLQRQKTESGVLSVSDLLSGKRKELAFFLEQNASASIVLEQCDPEMSFVIETEEKRIAACLITQLVYEKNYLISILMNSEASSYGIVLIKTLIEKAMMMDDNNTIFWFVAENEGVDGFIHSLAGDGDQIEKSQLKYAVLSLEETA